MVHGIVTERGIPIGINKYVMSDCGIRVVVDVVAKPSVNCSLYKVC